MALCRLTDVYMQYGRESVLRGVDLTIERGGILGLVGENGSGKSTLLKILAGVLRPDCGALKTSGPRPRIGYMPESSQWYPHLTGAQVLRYFARFSGVSEADQYEILETVGLTAARDKKVSAYSKGMRQKLGLAQAILNAPDLLVLDEPTNGLDPPSIVAFYDVLQERMAHGVAVVLSSHLLAEIEGRTTHVAFLHDGCIAASGTGDELVQEAGLPSRVWLRRAAQPERLQAALKAGGWQATTNGCGVEVLLQRSEVGAMLAMLDTAAEQQLDVEIQHPSLNDLYMNTLTTLGPPGQDGRTRVRRVEAP